MKEVLKLNWNLLQKTLLIICFGGSSLLMSAQTKTVTGTVTDTGGEEIIGASVSVKGQSKNGTTTDIGGKFTLEAAPDATLVVSYLGYKSQEVAVGTGASLRIVLKEDVQLLEEVVVVGYGTAKKADLAGNVATLNARDIEMVPVSNLTNALAGRIAGVTVRSGSGGMPGNAAELIVGTRGTWNNVAPLYVIDGIVRSSEAFNMLNSSDIESFSVLKDASAAAVYGARAANGVIIVTTKKGKSGKATITYSGSYSTGNPAYEAERESFEDRYRVSLAGQMDWRGVLPAGQAITENGYQPKYTSHYVNGKDASDGYISQGTPLFSDEAYAYYSTHQYDRLKEVYQSPVTMEHALNVSGGNESVTYYIGGNYYDETGMFKAVGYKKYSLRSNLDAKIAKNLTATLAMNIGNDNFQNAYDQNERMTGVYRFLASAPALAPGIVDGKYIVNSLSNTAGTDNSYAAVANGDAGLDKRQKWFSEYTAGLTWEIPWVKGLTAKAMYNRYTKHQYDKKEPKQYEVYSLLKGNDPATEYAKNGGLDPNGTILVPELGQHTTKGYDKIEQREQWDNVYQLNGQLSYANTFGKHAVEATLVYEQTETYGEMMKGSKPNLKVESRPFLNFGGDAEADRAKWALEGSGWESGRISYVGRFGYTYDNRYQAAFSFRNDLSSRFGPFRRQKSGFFPAGNVYWRASEESFLKDVNWLSNLKFRASVGLTGNDEGSGAFQYLNSANIGKEGMYWGGSGNPAAGVAFETIGNPAITWEESVNKNIGLDLGILDNMLNLSVNLWQKHTYNILGPQTGELPDVFGAKLADANYGIVDAQGFEIELGFNKQITKDIGVWARGNFSWADNKLVEYAESGVLEHLSKLGKNWDRWAMYQSDGIIWDVRPQYDGQGNHITKDYNDGNGPQNMYIVKTSNGNTYVVPKNYYISDSGRWFDNGHYNNLRPGAVFPVDIAGVDADGNRTGPDGHYDPSSKYDMTWGINHLNPPYNYGLLLGGSWKGISLEAFIQGTAGNQNIMKIHNFADCYWYGNSYGFWSGDAYSPTLNPTGRMPLMVNGPSDANASTNFWVRDASFLRLKNVTLAYDLPKSLLSKAGIAGAKVYVSGQNLCFLYNALKYFDPELTTHQDPDKKSVYNNPEATYINEPEFGGGEATGVANYPLMRTFTFGLTLSF